MVSFSLLKKIPFAIFSHQHSSIFGTSLFPYHTIHPMFHKTSSIYLLYNFLFIG
nr:MAG TPA: hypothetical protein [Caudoviricetes sp.]